THTVTGKAVSALAHDTDASTVEALSFVTEDEKKRCEQLALDLAKDPKTAAAEQSIKAGRISKLTEALRAIAEGTSDAAFAELLTSAAVAQTARQAAEAAAHTLFSGMAPLSVGTPVWIILWEAARQYALEVAYPDAPFPPTASDLLCVLCQQPVSDDARARMAKFELFIKDETKTQAEAASAALTEQLTRLFNLNIRLQPIMQNLQEVALIDNDLSDRILRALASARLRRHIVTTNLQGGDRVVPQLVELPLSDLLELERKIRAYAETLAKSSLDPARLALVQEHAELVDRQLLNTHLDILKSEIKRLFAISALEKCIEDTATNAITLLGTKIANEVLTTELKARFEAEMEDLVQSRIAVELTKATSQPGSPQYEVRLKSKIKKDVSQVLSEGEQTCTALAAFLAELSTATHKSALIFDDP
ncbi:MAG: hypothetical protein B7Z23_10835, partial [Pseudomonadales bacterium 32-61-5]